MVFNSHRRRPIRNCGKLLFFAFFLATQTIVAQDITVQVNKPGAPIRPTMWGIFFEDINMAADGGLYAELVKNRSFEFTNPLMGWQVQTASPANGTVLVLNRGAENPDNPRFIRITHLDAEPYGLTNEGFRGMGIKQGEEYHFSMWVRPAASMTLIIQLQAPDGKVIG